MIALAPLLPPELVSKAHAAAQEFTDQQLEWEVRSALWPYLPPGQLSAKLVRAISEHTRERTVISVEASAIIQAAALAPLLPTKTGASFRQV